MFCRYEFEEVPVKHVLRPEMPFGSAATPLVHVVTRSGVGVTILPWVCYFLIPSVAFGPNLRPALLHCYSTYRSRHSYHIDACGLDARTCRSLVPNVRL
jgi:hypothetical protein